MNLGFFGEEDASGSSENIDFFGGLGGGGGDNNKLNEKFGGGDDDDAFAFSTALSSKLASFNFASRRESSFVHKIND